VKSLQDKIAVVTGASRGAGRGIAAVLGEAGATVYVVGRTTRGGPLPPDSAPGTIEDTADEVTRRGGRGVAVRADCSVESDVAGLFERVKREQGHLDILVNAVWGLNAFYSELKWGQPFWKESLDLWPHAMNSGVLAYLAASKYAALMMAEQKRGLIIHVTDNVDDKGEKYLGEMYWDLGHACINRMVLGMSGDGLKHGFAVVGLNPGFMRTERVMMHLKTEADKKAHGLDRSESVEYIGRAVVALAGDDKILGKSGRLLWVADLAEEYGFTDVDGKRVGRFVV
jgi:NAD(P)-dependent dehydrogenase (short-subunit alcohol dehydrogenase family)